MRRPFALSFVLSALAAVLPAAVQAAPVDVLFVGNSFTFGRVDPVMSYNAANVNDLTRPERGGNFANPAGTNAFEPHPWGGVAGIFKQFTVQAGLDYTVSLSTRNAASLRGHFLNTNPAGWDLRGNIGQQAWDKVVLQEQSDEPLQRRTNGNGAVLASNPEYFRFYADKIENFVHSNAPQTIRDRDAFPGATANDRQAACVAAGIASGTCSNNRGTFANSNADATTQLYLYQTWARPNLVHGAFATTTNANGSVTRSNTLSTATFFNSLEEMTGELKSSYQAAFDRADNDGTAGFAGIAEVGEAFMRAVATGVATRDMWAADAGSDGLIDLWFDDGLHASKYGSYLSALVLFGELTGLDPARLGAREIAARDLGIDARSALLLQRVASDQLGFVPVPTPASGALAGLALLALAASRQRRR
ncbi:MAG: hypothetical protein RJA10_1336 [Pseudomonadota bacterium]